MKEYKWPKLEKKIDTNKKCSENEEKIWRRVMKLPETPPCEFTGAVVKGFGRGSRLLMMPTGMFFCEKRRTENTNFLSKHLSR